MTRIFETGFENGHVNYTSCSNHEVIAASAATKRSGSYSMHFLYLNDRWAKFIIQENEIYFRVAVMATIASGAAAHAIRFYNSGGELCSIHIYDASVLYAVGSTIVYTKVMNTLRGAQFALVEGHIKIADSGGIIQAAVNGILLDEYTGDTEPSSGSTITIIGFGTPRENGTNSAGYWDDIAINDTYGEVDNSWCGDGRILALLPNAPGDSNMLAPTSGSPINNYTMVDERPHDSDTTYVQSSTPGDYDLYNLNASGLDINTHTIKRIWAESVSKDTTTGSGIIKHVIKTSGSEIESGDLALTTSYSLIKSDDLLVNPITSNPWTPEELDALQVGIKAVR